MSITEKCLKCLQDQNWLDLNSILSDESNCKQLSSDPIFSIFETHLVNEVKRHENDADENLSIVLAHIFNLAQNGNRPLVLSNKCVKQVAQYLFDKHPSEQYARFLIDNKQAQDFLKKLESERKTNIDKSILSANLDIKIGNSGELDFSKPIFNSPQERELYFAAKKILIKEIIIPNIALSSIIDSKILKVLDPKLSDFFFKSTLDLCIINSVSFIPTFFIELDSSWHDKPSQISNDKKKDEIFDQAGLKLHRLRKLENKSMIEVFEIYLKEYYTS